VLVAAGVEAVAGRELGEGEAGGPRVLEVFGGLDVAGVVA
jgi:hypothetical protein